VVAGLGAFGAAVAGQGLEGALASFGLGALKGRPAVEVIALIAEHLSQDAGGVLGELLANALRDSLLEAAALVDELSYEDLETSLTDYFQKDGVEGLVELFLTRYVTDSVWALLENHAELTGAGESALDGMSLAVENTCRSHVHEALEAERQAGSFDGVDWFGTGGRGVADRIIQTIEQRLKTIAANEAS
jgi:hypothetical protein